MSSTKRSAKDSPLSPSRLDSCDDVKRQRLADSDSHCSASSPPLHEVGAEQRGGDYPSSAPDLPVSLRQGALEEETEGGGVPGWYDMTKDGSEGWFFHSQTQLYYNQSDGKYYRLVDSEYVAIDSEAEVAPSIDQNATLQLTVGAYSMKGNKSVQEDRYVIQEAVPRLHGGCIVGVFDGHGGASCAQFCADNFVNALLRVGAPSPAEWLAQAFDHVEGEWATFARRRANRSGSTALVVAIDKAQHALWCANVGDCRAVLCRDGQAVRLTNDHKPNDPAEKARVEAAGGFVLQLQVCQGILNSCRYASIRRRSICSWSFAQTTRCTMLSWSMVAGSMAHRKSRRQ